MTLSYLSEAPLMKLSPLVFLLGLLGAPMAMAQDYTCTLQNWKGARHENDAITKSWTGEGFMAHMMPGAKQAKVRRFYGKKAEKWRDAQVKSTPNFDTLLFYDTPRLSDGKIGKRFRFAFRIYKSGKCDVMVTAHTYRPLIADGRWK
jgi:hypothetical protein